MSLSPSGSLTFCLHFLFFSFISDSLVRIRLYIQHCMQLLGSVPQQAFQVTDKAVDIAFPRCLVDDILVIVVTQATAQLLIIHLRLVFSFAPPSSNLIWVRKLELPAVACPADEGLARLVG